MSVPRSHSQPSVAAFLPLRLALDDAITYGRFALARRLVKKAVLMARRWECIGEHAYFQGQREILEENYEKAIRWFAAATRFNPKDGAAFNDWALCLVEQGKIDEALVYFDRGIAAEPDYATVYHNKGWLLNKIGRYSEAIGYLKQALALDKKRAVTYENLADAYNNLGDRRRALQCYQKALERLDPACRFIGRQIRAQILRLQKNACPARGRKR